MKGYTRRLGGTLKPAVGGGGVWTYPFPPRLLPLRVHSAMDFGLGSEERSCTLFGASGLGFSVLEMECWMGCEDLPGSR